MKHRLEYAGFAVASRLLRVVPYALASRAGHAGGSLYYRLNRYRRRLALDNIEQALPELPESERRRVARLSFAHHGAMFFEAVAADRLAGHAFDDLFDVDGWEHIERLVAAGRGFFLIGGHFGAVEQALYPITQRLRPLHLVLKAQRNPYVNEAIRQMRDSRGQLLIYPKRAGHRMLNVVRKGGRVAIQIDQRVQPRDGALIQFLGRPAWTSIAVAQLSIHSGCPVVPLYCVPTAGGRFHLEIEPPIEPPERSEERGLAAQIALTRRYLASLEAQIRRRPDLWYWMHTRWRLTVAYQRPEVVTRLLRQADLPADRRLEGFDAERLPPTARTALAQLRRGTFLEPCRNVLVTGPCSSGRTHTAAALVEALVADGHPSRFAIAGPFLDSLLAARSAGREAETWLDLDRVELLAIDDADTVSGPRAEMLIDVLRQRQGRRSTLLVTSAQDAAGAGDSAASRIVDTLAAQTTMSLDRI